MHEAPLWQWVMVSLGAEPTYYGYPFSDRIGGERPLPGRLVEEYRDRVDVGASAVAGGPLKARSYPGDLREAPIEREEFIRWAQTTARWELPAEMREGEHVKPADSVEGTKRGRSLYRLVLGMAIRQYAFQPGGDSRGTAQAIAGDLELAGLRVTDDTIRECLKAAMRDLSDRERAALQPNAKARKK